MQKKTLPYGFVKKLSDKMGIKPGALAQRIFKEDKETLKIVTRELKRIKKENQAKMAVIKEYRETLDSI